MKQTLSALNSPIRRSGIALMVTVSIMALIAVVILGNLKLVDDSMSYSKQAKLSNQNQAMLHSFYTLLKNQAASVTSAQTLDAFLLTLSGIGDDKGLVELGINISSLQGKVNINAIFEDDNKTISPHYETMFLRIFEAYELKEGGQLLALIADTIDLDNHERYANSELINSHADISQGRIVNAQHLNRLAAYYDEAVEDSGVYKIPWDDFFRYGERNIAGTVDCNYMHKDLARFMGFSSNSDSLSDQALSCEDLASDQNSSKADFHIEAFNANKPYYLQVESDYRALNLSAKQRFIFEIKTKEISHIQSY